jgi:hypothetical protein
MLAAAARLIHPTATPLLPSPTLRGMCLVPAPQFASFGGPHDIKAAVLSGSDRLGLEHLSTLLQASCAALCALCPLRRCPAATAQPCMLPPCAPPDAATAPL